MTALRLVPSSSLSPLSSRAVALLGDTPTLTFVADEAAPDVCITLRLVRHGAVWLGVVSDRALFADRVRMGMQPRFENDVAAVRGAAVVRVVGRVADFLQSAVAVDVKAAVAALVGVYGSADDVVVEVAPAALAVIDDEDAVGSVPRT